MNNPRQDSHPEGESVNMMRRNVKTARLDNPKISQTLPSFEGAIAQEGFCVPDVREQGIIKEKCVDCGELRLGQSGIKEPRCLDCFRKWFKKEESKKEIIKKYART